MSAPRRAPKLVFWHQLRHAGQQKIGAAPRQRRLPDAAVGALETPLLMQQLQQLITAAKRGVQAAVQGSISGSLLAGGAAGAAD